MQCTLLIDQLASLADAVSSVDQSILQHMIDTGAEFLMEVTDKTKADVKVRVCTNM